MSRIQSYTSATGKQYSYESAKYSDSTRVDQRKAIDGRKKGWQISEMWDKHHEIARLLVLGMSNVDIATKLDCSSQLISQVKNSPIVKDKLAILHAVRDAATMDLAREIADLAPLALKRVREVLETGTVLGKEANAATILKEANAIIDRDQGKAIQRIDTRGVHAHLSSTDIEAIKQRAAELGGIAI